MQDVVEGKLEAGLFTADAWPEISRNAAMSREALKGFGTLNTIELIEHTEQDANRLYRYRLIYNEITLTCSMVLTKEGKIATLRLQPE